jgi:signal transduction histidine kinase
MPAPDPSAPHTGFSATVDDAGFGTLPANLVAADDTERPVANLAHILAHRMRGPLTSIQCYTDLLADDLYSAEQREMALRIFECAFALEGMLADLQRFTLSLNPVLRPVHPDELVAGLLAGIGEEAAGVAVELDSDAGPIRADGILLRQALLILLRNALEAEAESAAGGEAGAGVRVTIRADADALLFDVWNAARPAAPARVFEPFYTTKSANLGIGLSIARRIAEAHGGALTLSDEGAAGTTFTLRIPRGEELPTGFAHLV